MEEFRDEIYKWIIDTGITFGNPGQGGIPCNVFTKEYWIDYGHLRWALDSKWITELQAKQLINILELQEIGEDFK